MKITELLAASGIRAFSTQRCADDPALPYSGFSTCDYTGDNPVRVASCRRALAAELGIDPTKVFYPRQTHSLNVAVIDGSGASLEGVDAIVTALPGIALAIHTADCVPIVLADPAAGVIGAVHSGWRGTAGEIAAVAVETMRSLGASPERIIAAMGPCICPECFEVGEEVAEKFRACGCVVDTPAKPHVDLPKAVAGTLIRCGLKAENIAMPPACSRCNSDMYFSARRLGVDSGRTATVIMRSI